MKSGNNSDERINNGFFYNFLLASFTDGFILFLSKCSQVILYLQSELVFSILLAGLRIFYTQIDKKFD